MRRFSPWGGAVPVDTPASLVVVTQCLGEYWQRRTQCRFQRPGRVDDEQGAAGHAASVAWHGADGEVGAEPVGIRQFFEFFWQLARFDGGQKR